MSNFFSGIFTTTELATISVSSFLLCVMTALGIGIFLALVYRYHERPSKSFTLTLALLPAIVCVVIMMVNGNIGAGVAVAGAFSLVRFRSVPGSAKEIAAIFLGMGCGLICGMGYLGYAVLFAVILGAGMFLFTMVSSMVEKNNDEKILQITIPEDLDYAGVFDPLFDEYLEAHESLSVKTTNMGSMFKLRYKVRMKNGANEKAFIDAVRTRNGNLEVALMREDDSQNSL